MVGVVCLGVTSCGVLPTEEEFDAAPMVKEYEGADFNKVTVTRGTLQKTQEINGKYKGTVREEILADGVGVIKKINVRKGQRVSAGDVVMEYYIPGSEKALAKAENEIEKIQLQIKHAKELMALEAQKARDTGGSEKDVKNAKNQYEQQIRAMESNLKLLRMDVTIAKEEIDEGKVRASVSGRVKFVAKDAVDTYGDLENPTIIIEGKAKNRFEANSEYASHCKDGDVVSVDIRGQEYKATVKKDKESTDSVYFYPNARLNLEDGTVCSYKVILKEKKDILYIPSSIVYTMGDKHVVYYEDANGLKSTKEVTVGETIDNFIEITGGLEENEQVIAN